MKFAILGLWHETNTFSSVPADYAAVSVSHHDADTEIARRVRATLGPDVPVGMALDLHANLAPALLQHTDVITLYQTNPHLDARARARECAELVWRTARGEIRPVQWLETPPLVVSIVKQCTHDEPMRSITADAAEAARRPRMLSASAVEGYPYADVPAMGMSFLTIADGEPAVARDAARSMASRAWVRRDGMISNIPTPREALVRAVRAGRGPLVIMDVGDNVLGGSSADSTVLLAEARSMGLGGILQTLYDPHAVRVCEAAGVGARVELAVGAKTDHHHGRPLMVGGLVARIADGRYQDPTPTHGGFRFFDDGRRAVLKTDEGNTLVLTSERAGSLSLEQMRSLGLEPGDFPIVVVKGVVSPRAAYESIAAEMVLADTPGLTSADLSTFDYRHRRRPLFPFENEAGYDVAAHTPSTTII